MIPLGRGDLTDRVRRYLNVRGSVQLLQDAQAIPVTVLANLDADPFTQYPVRWSWAINTTGDATHLPIQRVSNPAGSNGVVTIRQLTISSAPGGGVQWGVARSSTTPAVGRLPQSTNLPGRGVAANTNIPNPIATFVSSVNTAPAFQPLGLVILAAGAASLVFPLENDIVLFPGDDFVLAGPVVAANMISVIEGADYVDTFTL